MHGNGSRGADQPAGRLNRPPAQARTAIVLAVLGQQLSAAEAAAAAGVAEAEVAGWISRFIESGLAGLRAGGRLPGGPAAARDQRSAAELTAENRKLRTVLHETLRCARAWRRAAHDTLGPLAELELIREDAAMPISRFCDVIGVPRRSYFRRLARMRSGENAVDRRAKAPSVQLCAPLVVAYAARWPGHGHRRIHALMLRDGHCTSPSTVLRAMRLLRWSGRGADGATSETPAVANQIPAQ